MGLLIDSEKCTGCGNCVPACPLGILEMVDDKAQVNEGCTLCSLCVEACDYDAISIEEAPETIEVSDTHRGIWVFAEQRIGKVKSVTHELLS